MKAKSLLLSLLITASASLAAQNSRGNEVFAPFVSRLEGEVKNNLVKLSWLDSHDARGLVYIYRSASPFAGAPPSPALKIAEVPYGTRFFVDEIGRSGIFYYFAAASDESGRLYNIPIASGNTISVEISSGYTGESTPGEQPAESAAQGGISSLEAAIMGGTVTVSFSGGEGGDAVVYRSTRPIRTAQDLLGAVIAGTKITSPFIDQPVPGIPYYYAVIYEEDLINGRVEIINGQNTTSGAVTVRAAGNGSAYSGIDLRPIPLPQISIETAIPGFSSFETPPVTELSAEAAKALGDIPEGNGIPVLKTPRVFARDMENQVSGGEEYALAVITRGVFAARNWEAAREELLRFLTLPRSQEAGARARFYLGQCYYFLQKPREGLFEFLAIRDMYPAEANEWIRSTLDMMRR